MNIRAIALALLLCLCLTACGGEPEESGGQMSLLETAAGLDGTEPVSYTHLTLPTKA